MNEVIEHVKAENAKTKAWIAEDPENRWAGFYSEDPEWWINERNVETMEDFHRWTMESTISDLHKDVYGFRPRSMNVSEMTFEELETEYNELVGQLDMQFEREKKFVEEENARIEQVCKDLNIARETYDRWMKEAA